jgi:putative transposase
MAGIPQHVMNRASRRSVIFGVDEDYRIFEDVLIEATRIHSMRLCDFTIMPNHWHLILWPHEDLQVSRFMQWLTMTQTQRWHVARGTTGTGPLYQGRFKAIPVQADDHFLAVTRYVQRNPVRASLARRVEEWRWSSARHRCNKSDQFLAEWPVPMPANWLETANESMEEVELKAIRDAIACDWPYGDAEWTRDMTKKFALNRARRLRRRTEREVPGPSASTGPTHADVARIANPAKTAIAGLDSGLSGNVLP